MPNNLPPDPSDPPNGTYTSTCGADFSSWDGSFTYYNGTIVYTRTNPSGTYNTSNTSNGNAIVFDLTDGTDTVQFNGSSFLFKGPNNKAEYKGHCHQGPTDTADGWTATQE
jgi:hypothetical protein